MGEISYKLVIDFETANRSATSACQVGFIVLKEELHGPAQRTLKIVHEEEHLIRPPLSPLGEDGFEFTHIHGITYDQVKNAPPFNEIYQAYIEPWHSKCDTLIGHNVQFDDKVLRMSAAHYGIDVPRLPTECTVKLARYKLAIKPANLGNVAKTLEIPHNHHAALSDAYASAMIYIYTLTREKPWIKEQNLFENLDRVFQLNSEQSKQKLLELLKIGKELP